HYALWKHDAHHRDVSPSNLKVHQTSGGRWIGVLNDYDLSSTNDTPTGNERTGTHTRTVPFVAMQLLKPKGIAGEVEHLYRHDAESFIWVLIWVCLQNGG
ncbi:hypothetical protein EDB19DRAFT_1641859, partial [Suillus lakei]